MKYTYLLLLSFLPFISYGSEHSFITFAPDYFVSQKNSSIGLVEKAWSKVEKEKKEKIESLLLGQLGLSSTGRIEISGAYRLTEDDLIGKEGERIFHFIQRDLQESRLFWSCLVNTDSMKVQLLYPTSDEVAIKQVEDITEKP